MLRKLLCKLIGHHWIWRRYYLKGEKTQRLVQCNIACWRCDKFKHNFMKEPGKLGEIIVTESAFNSDLIPETVVPDREEFMNSKFWKRPWCWIKKHDWRFTLKSWCYAKGYEPPVQYMKCYRCGKIKKELHIEGWSFDYDETTMEKILNDE